MFLNGSGPDVSVDEICEHEDSVGEAVHDYYNCNENRRYFEDVLNRFLFAVVGQNDVRGRSARFDFRGALFDEENGDLVISNANASPIIFGGIYRGMRLVDRLAELGFLISNSGGVFSARFPKSELGLFDHVTEMRVAERSLSPIVSGAVNLEDEVKADVCRFISYLIASDSRLSADYFEDLMIVPPVSGFDEFAVEAESLVGEYEVSPDGKFWFQPLVLFLPEFKVNAFALQFLTRVLGKIPKLDLQQVRSSDEGSVLTMRCNIVKPPRLDLDAILFTDAV